MAQMRLTMEMVNGPRGNDEMFEALSGGNPVAFEGCRAILEYAPSVDPDYARITVAYLFLIDVLEIWDDDLATLWKDVCGKHAGRMIALLRSCQSQDQAAAESAKQLLRQIIRQWPNGPHVDFQVLERELRRTHPRFDMEAIP
jgi:hypothetical protein